MRKEEGRRERNGRGMEGGGEIHESMVMKRAMGWRRMNRIGRRGDTEGSIDIIGRGATGRGTTGRGIGPTYTDKISRRGIRLLDLLDKQAEWLNGTNVLENYARLFLLIAQLQCRSIILAILVPSVLIL